MYLETPTGEAPHEYPLRQTAEAGEYWKTKY